MTFNAFLDYFKKFYATNAFDGTKVDSLWKNKDICDSR